MALERAAEWAKLWKLWPVGASPARPRGLLGGGVKGLPGRGLREAGLE